ncbi:MAG TPA: hypothetical protein VG734_16395, partial [Lacunisphaera sp.]|nr:hypothetical protein [Lacunisphaera sp.]
ISFLARLCGLGGISDRIRDIIARIRAPIERAMDRVADWIRRTGQRFLSRALGGDPNATPQQRLDRGLTEATAAINRLSGSAIGEAVIRPVLGAIRLRHNLQSLEPVRDGNVWAVDGVVNPRGRGRSNKQVAAPGGAAAAPGAGTVASPFELVWPKRRLSSYSPLWLVPRNVANGRTYSQAQLQGMPGAVQFQPAARRALFASGETIGVTTGYRTQPNWPTPPFGPAPNSRPSSLPKLESFKDKLREHGYDRERGVDGGETDADHVCELQMVGPTGDTFENLWPLNSSENRSSGSTLSNTEVTLPDGATRRIRDLPRQAYYFRIRSFSR